MGSRLLLSTRRSVPPERLERYERGWARLRELLAARGAHAWRFRAAAEPDLFLEFVEFAAGNDPRGDPQVPAALRDLEGAGAAAPTEEWEEG